MECESGTRMNLSIFELTNKYKPGRRKVYLARLLITSGNIASDGKIINESRTEKISRR